MQVYDPAANAWSTGAPLVHAVRNYARATVGSTFYAIGGYDFTNAITNFNQRYSGGGACASPTVTATASPTVTILPTATSTPACGAAVAWRVEPPMPSARAYAGGAVVNNQFYVISGFSGNAPDPAVARFDPATNSWATLSPIPTPISQARVAALGTKIYAAGGFNNGFGGQSTSMQIYDTATGLWSQGAPLPQARSGAGVAAANGKIHIIAGNGPGFAPQNTVYEYDPGSNTYQTRAPAPAAEGNIAVGVLGGLIYAVGGGATFMHYAYDPVANTWSTIAPGLTPNMQTPGVFALDGELWVEGGTNGFNPYPDNEQVQIYNPGSNSWRFGPIFNTPRYGSSAAGALNGRGYVAGGADASSGQYIASMELAGAGPCGSPTATATSGPIGTPTATSTVVCGVQPGWQAGPSRTPPRELFQGASPPTASSTRPAARTPPAARSSATSHATIPRPTPGKR